ncbi:MAG: hypothetical protein GY772_22940 [bacterium]|nr:hypothetical protein [bacterium]
MPNDTWDRAFHGTTMYNIASICAQGGLRTNTSALPPGIYAHKDGTKLKAQGYVVYSPAGSGLFIDALCEVRLRTHNTIRTDQWLCRDEADCQLCFVHFRVVRGRDLTPGNETITGAWRPAFEIPVSGRA